MPSLISRMRRGSESGNRPEAEGARTKRLSIDVSQVDHQDSPKSGKLKSLFGKHDDMDGSPNKMDSLRKKLTSPSTIFKTQAPEPDRPITPPPEETDPSLARYAAATPRTPPRAIAGNSSTNGSPRFPSPATSPQQFALSRSRSPENGAHRNSWTPSYPLVVPDDGYADIAPDGHAVSPPRNVAPLGAVANENSLRRSMQLDRPPTLDDIVPIQPDRPKPKPDTVKISPDSGLPTPPTSTDSNDTVPTVSRPSLSLDLYLDRPLVPTDHPIMSSTSTEATPTAGPQSPTPISPTLATPSTPNSSTADPTRPPRPVRQRTNLLTSPPMPQPIKNLPTLTGWSGFNSPTSPRTPGWGSLAREGGPRTPGGFLSPRTPGGGNSFPFNPIPLPRQTSKGPLSEGEVRKAKRAMVSCTVHATSDR